MSCAVMMATGCRVWDCGRGRRVAVTTISSSGVCAWTIGETAARNAATTADGFKISSLASVPAGPIRRYERKCERQCTAETAPRGISHLRSGPVSGLVGPGVSPSRRLAPAVAWMDTPARTYRCGGSRGFGGFLRAAPLSRFTPARELRRDTSNERVDCTTQVLKRRWESTLRTEAYTLT